MDERQIMIRALTYIEAHIEEPISLMSLAELEGYSVPQFYRIFKCLTGDTVAEYITRRKMIQAALSLQKSEETITEIAFRFGFESLEVFTRAFRRVYGVTPSQYRKNEETIQPIKRVVMEQTMSSEEMNQMTYSIKEIESFLVVGMKCKALKWDEDGAIARLWSDFLERIEDIPNLQKPMTLYGISECEQTTGGKAFTYWVVAKVIEEVENLPMGFEMKRIRSQKYIEANVPDKISIPQAYVSTIQYAKSLSYKIEDYDEIEVYGEEFKDADLYRFRLWVPIK